MVKKVKKQRIEVNVMNQTMEAIFDGKVFHPAIPPTIKPNTRVRIVIETDSLSADIPPSFLQVARCLNLEGPVDWSENLENYLYGDVIDNEG